MSNLSDHMLILAHFNWSMTTLYRRFVLLLFVRVFCRITLTCKGNSHMFPSTNVYVLHFSIEYMSGLAMLAGPEMYPRRGELLQQIFCYLFIMLTRVMCCYVSYVKLHVKYNS